MVPPPAHSTLLLPYFKLLLDALRGCLPAHRSGLRFHNGEPSVAVHDNTRLGNTTTYYNHVCLRQALPGDYRADRKVSVSLNS